MITHQACPRKRVLSVPRQRVSLEGDFLYSQKIENSCQALSTTVLVRIFSYKHNTLI
nr:MAG TPA: hypothetical protein [Siphoviridae sp. ctRJB2]